MFLSGTILRQIAQSTPALTRPARRRDSEKLGFWPALPRWQCCPQANQGGPASCWSLLGRGGRPGRYLGPATRRAASAAGAATGSGRVPTRWPLTLARSARMFAERAARLATMSVRARSPSACPVRGRRDGQAPAQSQARGRASDCAWTVLGHGSPGRPARCQAAAQRTRCDTRVTTAATGRGSSGSVGLARAVSLRPAAASDDEQGLADRGPGLERGVGVGGCRQREQVRPGRSG
jgi:hypothetical protein